MFGKKNVVVKKKPFGLRWEPTTAIGMKHALKVLPKREMALRELVGVLKNPAVQRNLERGKMPPETKRAVTTATLWGVGSVLSGAVATHGVVTGNVPRAVIWSTTGSLFGTNAALRLLNVPELKAYRRYKKLSPETLNVIAKDLDSQADRMAKEKMRMREKYNELRARKTATVSGRTQLDGFNKDIENYTREFHRFESAIQQTKDPITKQGLTRAIKETRTTLFKLKEGKNKLIRELMVKKN